MNKKLVALMLCVAILASALTAGTIAWFTAEETMTNTFTVGNVKIDLTEPAWTAEGGGEDEGEEVYPGEALAKDPTVQNIGENPCFVRISVTNLDQFGDKGMITLRHGQWEEGYDDEHWTYYDGYYYYNKPIKAEDDTYNTDLVNKTEPLFNQIVMPTGLTGDEDVKGIEVKAEAVQAQGADAKWSVVKSMKVEDIADWFKNCGL
ncbi:MAG: hypothetical protein E7218_08270 [Anaerofustis stercorihominis]|nr:hypothetical protein [Anaerofustis stercorihominis]